MKTKVTAIVLAGILILSMIGNAACFAETYATPGQTEASGGKIGVLSGDTAAESGDFWDVPESAFFFEPVNWAVEQGITKGVGENTFGPGELCNRAQVVTFLWRMAGKPAPASGGSSFTDVAAGSWYENAVLWAVENQVTSGVGDGIFQPEGICNRAQIVTFLWKYAGKPAAEEPGANPFTDVKADDWFAKAVAWAVEQGITKGLSETAFGPGEPCNRAQVVTFLYRYAGILPDEPDVTEPTEPKPTEPKPTEPEPTEPKPTEPEPTEPKPTEPEPTEPKPTEPEPTEPEPTEPDPTEPDPTEPTGPDWGLGGEDF